VIDGGLPADYLPLASGRGPRYRVSAVGAAVARHQPVAGMRCTSPHPSGYGIHLELYAARLVVPLPAGIGIAPPLRRTGAYVAGGACAYPLRTYEPTGVFVIDPDLHAASLGRLFAVWGQPLSRRRVAGFTGIVSAFVDGRRWRGGPGTVPLHRHAEIVLEIDGLVPPHRTYLFAHGL
jgi:hypothetical protein